MKAIVISGLIIENQPFPYVPDHMTIPIVNEF